MFSLWRYADNCILIWVVLTPKCLRTTGLIYFRKQASNKYSSYTLETSRNLQLTHNLQATLQKKETKQSTWQHCRRGSSSWAQLVTSLSNLINPWGGGGCLDNEGPCCPWERLGCGTYLYCLVSCRLCKTFIAWSQPVVNVLIKTFHSPLHR